MSSLLQGEDILAGKAQGCRGSGRGVEGGMDGEEVQRGEPSRWLLARGQQSWAVMDVSVLSPHAGGAPSAAGPSALPPAHLCLGQGITLDPPCRSRSQIPYPGNFFHIRGMGGACSGGAPPRRPPSHLRNIPAAVKETKRAFCRAGFFFVSPSLPFSPWHAFYPALRFRAPS